ncbi:GNAT family N-acetyltransferase [Streptomyces sp. NPDC012888]|uniref:GNAT family N-acetyltransferase n=1 Tax=Streptomyces sp. NPDC012888 TaxID=3364855 RepID=UPI00369B8178
MTWSFTRDLGAYLRAAGPALAARPVTNTLLLTVTDALRRRGPHAFGDGEPFYGWWTDADGAASGALLCTPPHPLLLGELPTEAVAALDVAALPGPVGGFNARRADAAALAAAWGRPTRVEEELRLYRLDGLVPPEPAPAGRPRPAATADLPLLRTWSAAFAAETDELAPPPDAALLDRVSYGGLLLWEDGGRPVAMAGFSRPLAGTARIYPVYTPPALRGRGYAAGVTAAATRAVRAAGAAEVLLFTDLANPTSNGVYQRLGYRPVEDRAVVVTA